jgi:hypothetical protein
MAHNGFYPIRNKIKEALTSIFCKEGHSAALLWLISLPENSTILPKLLAQEGLIHHAILKGAWPEIFKIITDKALKSSPDPQRQQVVESYANYYIDNQGERGIDVVKLLLRKCLKITEQLVGNAAVHATPEIFALLLKQYPKKHLQDTLLLNHAVWGDKRENVGGFCWMRD